MVFVGRESRDWIKKKMKNRICLKFNQKRNNLSKKCGIPCSSSFPQNKRRIFRNVTNMFCWSWRGILSNISFTFTARITMIIMIRNGKNVSVTQEMRFHQHLTIISSLVNFILFSSRKRNWSENYACMLVYTLFILAVLTVFFLAFYYFNKIMFLNRN